MIRRMLGRKTPKEWDVPLVRSSYVEGFLVGCGRDRAEASIRAEIFDIGKIPMVPGKYLIYQRRSYWFEV